MGRDRQPPAELRELTTCLCFRLRGAARAVTHAYDRELRETGLLSTQVTLLGAVALAGPIAIRDLASGLALQRSTVGRNLAPLVRDGLVAMRPGEDRRERLVEITATGSERLSEALPVWKRAQRRLLEELGDSAWSDVLTRVDRFAGAGPNGD